MANSWLEELLANLQGQSGPQPYREGIPTGLVASEAIPDARPYVPFAMADPMADHGNVPSSPPAVGAFGMPISPPSWPSGPAPVDEAAAAAAAREAAGARLIAANQRRSGPFGAPGMDSAGVQLAMDQAPAGTGVPVQGSPQFQPFGIPPSMIAAKAMTAPPAPPMQPQAPIAGLEAPIGGAPAAVPPGAPTDVSARARPQAPVVAPAAPMSIAAPAGPVPAEMSTGGKIAHGLSAAAPMLLGLGAALQGDQGHLTVAMRAREEAKEQLNEQRNLTAKALIARGAPPGEVAAAIKQPELLKALIGKYFETGKPLVVGGHVVREKPGGGLEVLGDFSADEKKKNPVVKDFKLADGSVVQKQWDPDKETWNPVKGFEAPVPGERDRRMSVADITKLSEEGGKAQQVTGFRQTFQPGFAGWKINKLGEWANEAGRNLPESVVGPERAAASAWWQDYDKYKNVVRHGLYGASLTANEQKAFTAADITPGMDPKQIQKNLETQERIVLNSIRKKGQALIGSTYDKGAVSKAFGVPPEFFDQPDIQPPGVVKPGNYVWKNGALVPQ